MSMCSYSLERGCLTSAICNQIIDWIRDPALPRYCAAPDCNRIFKRQRKFQEARTDSRSASDSVYCSDRCRERHKQQRRRERRKAAALKEGDKA